MIRSSIPSALRVLNKFFEYFAVVLFASVILTIMVQVFFRYIVRNPLKWIEEITRFLFIWMVFIGSIVAHKRMVHPRVDILIERFFSVKAKRVLQWFTSIYILVFLGIMFYGGTLLSSRLKFLSLPTSGLSLMYLYMVLPISAGVMALNEIEVIAMRCTELQRTGTKDQGGSHV